MIIYAVVKFVAYSLWCWFGLYLFAVGPGWVRALKFGAARWLLGLVFGLIVAIGLGSVSKEDIAKLYFSIYLPLRVIEWSIMAAMLTRGQPERGALLLVPKVWGWILGGIAVSFFSDLASPEGMAGRFCVGRCLC